MKNLASTLSKMLFVVGIAACADDDVTERPEPICGRPTLYEIDRLDLPRSTGDALAMAVNVDGDDHDVVDNLYGAIRSTLVAAGEIPLPDEIAPVERMVLSVTECSDGVVRVELGEGEPAEGTFDVAGLSARGGTGSFPAADLVLEEPTGEGAVVIALGVDARYEGDELSGTIGFGLTDRVVQKALADEANLILARDAGCPAACETVAGQHIVDEIDVAPANGFITAQEIASSELWKSLTKPDLDLVGDDGVVDRISAGVRFHAVPMRKTP